MSNAKEVRTRLGKEYGAAAEHRMPTLRLAAFNVFNATQGYVEVTNRLAATAGTTTLNHQTTPVQRVTPVPAVRQPEYPAITPMAAPERVGDAPVSDIAKRFVTAHVVMHPAQSERVAA